MCVIAGEKKEDMLVCVCTHRMVVSMIVSVSAVVRARIACHMSGAVFSVSFLNRRPPCASVHRFGQKAAAMIQRIQGCSHGCMQASFSRNLGSLAMQTHSTDMFFRNTGNTNKTASKTKEIQRKHKRKPMTKSTRIRATTEYNTIMISPVEHLVLWHLFS